MKKQSLTYFANLEQLREKLILGWQMFEERDRSPQDRQVLPHSIGPCIEAKLNDREYKKIANEFTPTISNGI